MAAHLALSLAVALAADLDQFHIHHLLLSPPISELACRHLRIDRLPADAVELSKELSYVDVRIGLPYPLALGLLSFPWLYCLCEPGNQPHLRYGFRQEAACFLDLESVEPESLAVARSHPD